MHALFAAAVLISAPFAASAVATAVHSVVRLRLLRTDRWEHWIPTGRWVEHAAASIGLPVEVSQVTGQLGSGDAYWPTLDRIALLSGTWHGHHPTDLAIGAHELGHAAFARGTRLQVGALLAARFAQPLADQLLIALVLVNLLYASPTVHMLLPGALAATVCLHLALLVDELRASQLGCALLDPHLPNEPMRSVEAALLSALGIYAAGPVARLGLLAAWPWLEPALRSGMPLDAPSSGPLAVYAVLLLAPIPILRAAQVLTDMVHPQPVQTELRLAWISHLDNAWAMHTALVLLLWAGLVWNLPMGRDLLPLVLLAACSAIRPLAHVGRALVLLPLWLVTATATRTLGEMGVIDHPAERLRGGDALAGLPVDELRAGWLHRLGSLLDLAYLPLLVVLLSRAFHAW